jgi:hypothetical protein
MCFGSIICTYWHWPWSSDIQRPRTKYDFPMLAISILLSGITIPNQFSMLSISILRSRTTIPDQFSMLSISILLSGTTIPNQFSMLSLASLHPNNTCH